MSGRTHKVNPGHPWKRRPLQLRKHADYRTDGEQREAVEGGKDRPQGGGDQSRGRERGGKIQRSRLDSDGAEPSESMPVRKGEEKAVITVNLGDLVVRRTITPDGGGTLTVTDADGLKN